MKSSLYLAKEPGLGVRDDLSKISGEVTIVDCLNSYGDWYEKKGYNCISIKQYFELDGTMRFDVIIGNPPYQGKSTSDKAYDPLWTKFWSKAFRLVKPGGKISLITPLTWCSPTSDLDKKHAVNGKTRLWDIFSEYTTVANVTTIKDHFKGVGSTFSLVTVDTSGSDGLSFTDGYNASLGFYPLSGKEEVEKNISIDNNIASRYTISGRITPGWRVSLLKTRKINETNVEVCESMEKPKTGANDTLYTHIYCNTKKEAEMVRSRLLECSDILYKHCRYSGFIDLKVMGMISLPSNIFEE